MKAAKSANTGNKSSGKFLKMVGAVAAVVSLFLGINQVTGIVQKLRIHHQEFSETMTSGQQQMERGDYPSAFNTFKHAVELDPVDRDAQTSQAKAAMLWLENVHAQGHSFADTANLTLPVLDNALTRASGSYAADLRAHIGWANFLRYREGLREGVTIDENFRDALKTDPGNVYAHAMLGFWDLWEDEKLEDAKQHFASALASGREHAYVRDLQVSAYMNKQGYSTDSELLRIANEMRKKGEPLAAHERSRILWSDFTTHLHSRDELVKYLSVLSPDDTGATYDWLSSGSEGDEVYKRLCRAFIAANLKEIAGDRAEALSQYKALQTEIRGTRSTLINPVEMSIQRLSNVVK